MGAIESVDYAPRTARYRGHVRFVLRDRSGYDKQPLQDANAYLIKNKDTAATLARTVAAALATAPPIDDYGATGTVEEVPPNSRQRLESRRAALAQQFAQQQQQRAERDRTRQAQRAYTVGSVTLRAGTLTVGAENFSITGAKATVEAGIAQSRMTATRVIGGAAVAGPIGVVLGALARKNTSHVYLTIELADGTVVLEDVPAKNESAARELATALNNQAHAEEPS